MKTHFSPYRFEAFLPDSGTEGGAAYFDKWIGFFSSRGFEVRVGQAANGSVTLCPCPTFVAEVCGYRFEMHSIGGLIPSISGGFVHAENDLLGDRGRAMVVEHGIANLVEFGAVQTGKAISVQTMGHAWAVYLASKVRQDERLKKGKALDASAASTIIAMIKEDIGEHLVSFEWPLQIRELNFWLANCDNSLSCGLKNALDHLLKRQHLSLSHWFGLRE
jgi:hypothetical protein